MELTFVKSGGVLFVGMVKEIKKPTTDPGLEYDMEQLIQEKESSLSVLGFSGIILHNPRMVFANQTDGMVSLAKCIANPEFVEIAGFEFQYVCGDPDFAIFYDNNVKEIEESEVVEPSNVISIVK